MNDDELTTLIKEPFASVHMTVPLDQVVQHGRAARTRRRRRRGLTGAVALAGAAIAAVALLVPSGHPPGPALAAWTVTRFPDGGFTVTVHQMRDPAGLQATLRADGIPARVTFDPVKAMTQPLPAGCTAPEMSDRTDGQLQVAILTPPAIVAYLRQHERLHSRDPIFTLPPALQKLQEREEQDATGRAALYINPAAIPAGIGLSIGVDVTSPLDFSYGVDLVRTSSQCTGS
jgi:hypothetical protein